LTVSPRELFLIAICLHPTELLVDRKWLSDVRHVPEAHCMLDHFRVESNELTPLFPTHVTIAKSDLHPFGSFCIRGASTDASASFCDFLIYHRIPTSPNWFVNTK
jgi:hypothetical protein